MTFESYWSRFGQADAERVIRLIGTASPPSRQTEALVQIRAMCQAAWAESPERADEPAVIKTGRAMQKSTAGPKAPLKLHVPGDK
jgi:hypothetical protein